MTITQDSSAPLVAVVGATGNQGKSVVDHLASSSKPYRVRAVTRDAKKDAAKALASNGAEVVEYDLEKDDQAKKAFAGADIVFAVTQFWAHLDKAKEIKDGKILADAAKAGGAKLYVWSGLEHVEKATNGKLKNVDHFDGKADILDYANSIGLNTVNVEPACYLQNFEGFLRPQKSDDGWSYYLPIPGSTEVHWVDITRDYGNFVVAAIETPDNERPKDVHAFSQKISVDAAVAALAKQLGEKVKFVGIPPEKFEEAVVGAGLPQKVAVETSEMWQFFHTNGYYGGQPDVPLKNLQHPTSTAEEYFGREEAAIKALFK